MKRGTIIIKPNRIAVALSSDETVWMTVEEIASIFHVTASSIERRIAKLLTEGELDEHEAKTEQNRIRNGKRYIAEYYNLDMVIALSYRIDTPASKVFRRWVGERVLRSLKRKTAPPLILRIERRNEIAN